MRFVIAALLLLSSACATNDGVLAFRNVTVIDGTGAPARPAATIIVRRGTIDAVQPAAARVPRGAQIVDGTGKYVIPGLIDMHTHLSFFGAEALPVLVRYGVLAVRDLGGSLDELDRWRADIDGGRRVGPRIYRAGPYVDGPKKMSGKRAETTIVVNTPDEGRAAVASLQQRGVDTIKTHNGLAREPFLAIADECRRRGLPLATHPPTRAMRIEEVSDAGVTTIEHIEMLTESIVFADVPAGGKPTKDPVAALDELTDAKAMDLFARFVRNHTAYDPTLVGYRSFMQEAVDLAPKDPRYEPAAVGRSKMFHRFVELVGLMQRAGVQVVAGTDFGIRPDSVPYPVPMPGTDLHDELKLFVEAGFTPMQAIQSATSIPARILRADAHLGTIEAGKWADFVVLDRDPIADIANTRAIAGVVLRGKWLTRQSLEAGGAH